MIALIDNLPVIRLPDGECVAFDKTWFTRIIREAATRAGFEKWPYAHDVMVTITTYFQEIELNVVTCPDLDRIVRVVLRTIGYEKIGDCFSCGRPPIRISLDELARRADTGYELAFFEMLRAELRKAAHSQLAEVELRCLDRCVRRLRSQKHWSRGCDTLQDDIVEFARNELGHAPCVKSLAIL